MAPTTQCRLSLVRVPFRPHLSLTPCRAGLWLLGPFLLLGLLYLTLLGVIVVFGTRRCLGALIGRVLSGSLLAFGLGGLDGGLGPLFGKLLLKLGVDVLVVGLRNSVNECSKVMSYMKRTRSALMKRIAACVSTACVRSATGSSSFLIFWKYCLTRVSSVKTGCCFASTPWRRRAAG